jgi:death-on-curing protein
MPQLALPSGRIHPELERRLQKIKADIGNDEYVGEYSLGIFEVLDAHFCLADYFFQQREGMSDVGPRDINLLHSALSRQKVPFVGEARWREKFDIAASLFFGLVRNHAFHDGNKRTAFVSCTLHLQKFRRKLRISHKEFEDFTVHVANKTLTSYDDFRDFQSSPDGEINFISRFLQRNSKHSDHHPQTITYRQLKWILERFGFSIDRPQGNYAGIIKISQRSGPWKDAQIGSKVMTIGYPGDSREIEQRALKEIRKHLGLDNKYGIDTEDFFSGTDPFHRSITYYEEALRRLAFR